VTTLSIEECSRFLSLVREIKQDHALYDSHVHPYEVLFDNLTYREAENNSEVLTLEGQSYTPPLVTAYRFSEAGDFDETPRAQRLREISCMLLKKIYGCVGQPVFEHQMELSGIDTSLLLPVAAETTSMEQFNDRLLWVGRHYRDSSRFWTAGSVSGDVKTEDLQGVVAAQQSTHGIKAMKCHPVVTGIDLREFSRKKWVEGLLAACGGCGLPVVLHSGRNNPYWGGPRGDFAALENCQDINFSASRSPVVLAHAGFHRCRLTEMERDGIRILKGILDKHPNVYVDISGLTLQQLKVVVTLISEERILFGSDALYYPQWEAVALTLHALNQLNLPLEKYFLKFAHINPQRAIFQERGHAKPFADQASPVH